MLARAVNSEGSKRGGKWTTYGGFILITFNRRLEMTSGDSYRGYGVVLRGMKKKNVEPCWYIDGDRTLAKPPHPWIRLKITILEMRTQPRGTILLVSWDEIARRSQCLLSNGMAMILEMKSHVESILVLYIRWWKHKIPSLNNIDSGNTPVRNSGWLP